MKISTKQLNKLAEKVAFSAVKQVIKEQRQGRSRDELAIAYTLIVNGIDPVQADMDMTYEKVIPLLLNAPYEDEVDLEKLSPELNAQLDDVVFEYGTLYDDDIVWDAKELGRKKSAEHGISFDGLNEQVETGEGKLAWLFRFRTENSLSNEELLEDISEICEKNETVWKFLTRGLKHKYAYKAG